MMQALFSMFTAIQRSTREHAGTPGANAGQVSNSAMIRLPQSYLTVVAGGTDNGPKGTW
jgi:hypothetical protein